MLNTLKRNGKHIIMYEGSNCTIVMPMSIYIQYLHIKKLNIYAH